MISDKITFHSQRYYNTLPLKLPVNEVGLTAETGLTINIFLWNKQITNPIYRHDEFPLHQRKENNFLSDKILNAS